jgi:hypothetical protein
VPKISVKVFRPAEISPWFALFSKKEMQKVKCNTCAKELEQKKKSQSKSPLCAPLKCLENSFCKKL